MDANLQPRHIGHRFMVRKPEAQPRDHFRINRGKGFPAETAVEYLYWWSNSERSKRD